MRTAFISPDATYSNSQMNCQISQMTNHELQFLDSWSEQVFCNKNVKANTVLCMLITGLMTRNKILLYFSHNSKVTSMCLCLHHT